MTSKESSKNSTDIKGNCCVLLCYKLFNSNPFWVGNKTLLSIKVSKTRAPEIPRRRLTNTPMDIIFRIAEIENDTVHIHFKRPKESGNGLSEDNVLNIYFYSPRLEIPDNRKPNDFWIALQERTSLLDMIYDLMETLNYDVPSDKKIHLYFGWPLSSWLDRISIGVMTYRLMRLPKKFPQFFYHIDYKPA